MEQLEGCHCNKAYQENDLSIDQSNIDYNNNKCCNNEIYNTHNNIYDNDKDDHQIFLSTIGNDEKDIVNEHKTKVDKTNGMMNEKREEVYIRGDIQGVEGCTNCNCQSMGIVEEEFLLKNILGTHYNKKNVKISISVIYGSGDGNSYNKAKDFINELIEYFKNVHLFFKDINDIINKNIYINNINGNMNYDDILPKKDYIEKKIQINESYKNDDNVDHSNMDGNIIDKNNCVNNSLDIKDMNSLENEIIEYFKLRFDKYQVNKKKRKEKISNYENMIPLYYNKNINYLEPYEENVKMFNSKFKNYVGCTIDNKNIGKIYFNLIDGNNHDYYSFFDCTENYNLNVLFFFISTSSHGSFPNNSYKIDEIFTDMLNDFRIEKNYLKDIFFSCIGFGNKEYGDKYFCTPIKKCEKYIHLLGAQKLYKTLKLCDTQDNDETILLWKCNIFKTFSLSLFFYSFNYMKRWTGENCVSESETSSNQSYPDDEDEQIEVEDLISGEKKDMLSSSQRNKLTKEGYKIVGSHSAVKLCRWTKSQVRGRGGCYKHTFYGINSYQCMEATPSLACANKCVFCWRHHKNPVGVKWRWNMDKAEIIVEEIIKKHKAMIKELKGIYGIIMERFEKAMNIKHCALSLVGEPIMYPEINKLIDELHKRNISTFLVTNAQFPQELENLNTVTQLYLSIDAPNKEALKNIDRPLFKDFWDRYIKCIKILKNRKERKVFRFTLVKEYNMMENEIDSYINLIQLGYPDFIEIKAVTYCGSSQGYQLTMQNIPWHEEVYQFAWNLINKKKALSHIYEISCEHKHSCSILITKKIFKINNKWNTWIDYEKFHQLVKNKENFNALDYSVETPHWAIYGSQESGFSPCEKRVYTKGKYKNKNQQS
ncbi:hypothetical protein PFFVO_01152 [Plasmodium falciparum Vietnam Oak-Knoll (FVO)]|uniref:tRNA 4-demethylwyosine synthase (AdoMet-dependent) n=1 Tax=Plasmodium falciparum Vietnam Oak-Knoll (FVO) TaxID=1036723 RepID=A0A024VBI9_PLAFA|nr:hypothetical protein PFFVO_01152 [Plasmodium falciparum Vietnam Oak-Knoll (FVO)]